MKKLHLWIFAAVLCSLPFWGCSNSESSSGSSQGGDQSGSGDGGGDQSGSGDGGGSSGTSGRCNSTNCSATCCGDVCRDTTSNKHHCGACDNACGKDEICVESKCKPIDYAKSCRSGELLCGDQCIDVTNDNANCGACGNACGEGTVCRGGSCEADCGELSNCSGKCVDTMNDGLNCGACGQACNEGEWCSRAKCTTECLDGKMICGHACVDLQTDPMNCGACGTACDVSEVCAAGACSTTCEDENMTICSHTCVDLTTNNDHCGVCGQKCGESSYCLKGECASTCEAENQVVCNHQCVDLTSDHDNCGSCGNVCSDKHVCTEGVCGCPADDPYCDKAKPVCENGTTLCGIECADLQKDEKHCGACDNACAEGEICQKGTCLVCEGDHAVCGDGSCVNLKTDPANCGACGTACPPNVVCTDGACAGCKENYVDCNGDPADGCEALTTECVCKDGETQQCYTGPAGTKGVGICSAGTTTCVGGKWSECVGMVLPDNNMQCEAACADPSKDADRNCDGVPDCTGDFDKDGFSVCAGDCCDTKEMCNVDKPELIGPGMYEVPGNKIDDNCNGKIDEVNNGCHVDSNAPQADQLAQAMDICDRAAYDGYGLVSAKLYNMKNYDSVGVFTKNQAVSGVRNGNWAAGLSSGIFDGKGSIKGSSHTNNGNHEAPSKYLNAHHGKLQTAEGCSSGSSYNDMVRYEIKLKAPKNATGFKFDFRFYSVEYPQYVCSTYNDFFLAMLTSNAKGLPKDGNIAFDKIGNPVSVNNAFFTYCKPISCYGSGIGSCKPVYSKCDSGKCANAYGSCPDGTDGLTKFSREGESHGATAWLTTTAPVVPGETFTLEFYIWDTGDQVLDSSVFLDNFRWILNKSDVTVDTDFSDGRT